VAFETHLPTQPQTTSKDARIPRAHEDSGRPRGFEAPASKGPLSADTLRVRLASEGFPKSYRLLRRSEFRRVYDQGQRRSASLATVFVRPNALPHSRLGITTPVRLGKAVLRNRLKRRLREVFRLNRENLPGGWDILVNPRQAVGKIPFKTLERDLLRLFPTQPPPPPAKETQ